MSDMLRRVIMMMQKAAAVTYATWNPSDMDAGLTLSGGNLVASVSTGSNVGVRATVGKSTGKWYWEVKVTTADTNGTLGVLLATAARSNQIGSPNGVDVTWNGVVYKDGVSQGQITGAWNPVNTVISFALDADAGTLAIRINNVLQTTQTGLSALTYFPSFVSSGTTQVITANFGASAFVYSPPAGFNAGLF